jgi:RimJ/RimL family protein N-acetyltransferase
MMARSTMDLTIPDLHDDRIALRPPAPSDVGAITAAVQDPDIPRFTMVPAPYTAADAVTFVGRTVSSWRSGRDATFVIVDRATGALLGAIGLHEIDDAAGTAQVGYWVDAAARRRGVATRALSLVTGWARDELGLRRVVALVFTDNPWSRRVVERVGFVLEAGPPTEVGHQLGPRSAFVYALTGGDGAPG